MNNKERNAKIQWFKDYYRLDRFSNLNEPYLPSATEISYDDLLWLIEQNEKLLKQLKAYQEDMQEIAEIIKSFYIEDNGNFQLPLYLLPIADQIGLIHRIALGEERKRFE